jgi:hypothetical protein
LELRLLTSSFETTALKSPAMVRASTRTREAVGAEAEVDVLAAIIIIVITSSRVRDYRISST